MKAIQVQLFAGAREAAGADQITIEVPSDCTYGGLADRVASDFPGLQALLGVSRFAAAGQYATKEMLVDETVEIALIPPVSGG
ncbi:MAG: MoaD/ThiS family protein [Planctomycetota bacterium]